MALPATDNFDRADGGVGANWTDLVDSFVVVSNRVQSTTDFSFPLSLAAWTADSPPDGHYAQLRIVTLAVNGLSPGVRVSVGDNGYWMNVQSSSQVLLARYVAGDNTNIQTINVALADGDVFRIAIDVSGLIKVFQNGGQIGVDQVDDSLTGGAFGLMAYRNTGVGDDFECGEWTEVGSTQALSIVSIMPALEL